MNFDTHKYFLNFTMSHLAAAVSPTKVCLEFSSGDTVDLEMKEIGCRHITSRDLSNSQFPPAFYYAYNFIPSYETSECKRTAPIPSLGHSILM